MAKPSRRKVDEHTAAAWKSFYETDQGRLAIAELMLWCGVYTINNQTDPLALARETGERNVALRIAHLIGLQPGQFPQVADEHLTDIDRLMRH